MISPEELSSLIGDVYDCAIDVRRWPATLGRLNGYFKSAYAGLMVAQIEPFVPIAYYHSDWDPGRTRQLAEQFVMEITGVREALTGPVGVAIDLLDRLTSSELIEYQASTFYHQWVKPQGLYDSCVMRVAQTRNRTAALHLIFKDDRGVSTPDERALMELLSPHVSRAVLISDLLGESERARLDMVGIIDALAAPVIIADGDARIIHSNVAAKHWLGGSAAMTTLNGRLSVSDGRAKRPMLAALQHLSLGDVTAGAHGVGVPLDGDERPTACYMLPLNNGDARPHWEAGRVALFVAQASHSQPVPETMLEALFGLTPAESRMTKLLQVGESLSTVQDRLGISANTAKFHLRHIFEKTGATSQRQLQKLADDLAPPIAPAARPKLTE